MPIIEVFADDKMTYGVIQNAIAEGINADFILIREFKEKSQIPPRLRYIVSDYVMAYATGVQQHEL
jgi:hypothetical protein